MWLEEEGEGSECKPEWDTLEPVQSAIGRRVAALDSLQVWIH
jgi:hypothetical protein